MNAAIAVHGDYAYIGSRTDGGHEGMPYGGVMVVDISDPAAPALLGPPLDAKPAESSRELRVRKSQDILIVLNTNCGVGDMLHQCTHPSISNFGFYDISGRNASSPRLLDQFNADTHEFFLWEERLALVPRQACLLRDWRVASPSSTCPTSPPAAGRRSLGRSPLTGTGPRGQAREPTARSTSGTATGSGCPTRCRGRRPRQPRLSIGWARIVALFFEPVGAAGRHCD